MNDFKMRLRVNNMKAIDKVIQNVVNEEMQNLEDMVDKNIVKYCEQIHDRKEGIRDILDNFDYNMGVIEERKRYSKNDIEKGNSSVEEIIDDIIKKQITKRMENMYQEVIKNQGENNRMEVNETAVQLLDRQVRIGNLLEDYNGNMEILHSHNQEKQSKNDVDEERIESR